MRFGSGDYVYELCENWGQDLAECGEADLSKISNVVIDEEDRVYILTRSARPVIVTGRDGSCIASWSSPVFGRPHDMAFDGRGGVYVADDHQHAVYKLDREGNVLMRLGTPGAASDTGYNGKDYRTIKRSAGPFNRPTGVSVAENGDIYVSDGYGNACIHRFGPDGSHIASWGEPGVGPGQFFLPHGLLVHRGVVYVADRENSRVQLFDLEGRYLSEWNQLHRPSVICVGPDELIYICECKRNDNFADMSPSRFCIMTREGELVARIDNEFAAQPFAHYHAAHGIAVDSRGDVYIGEVGKPTKGHLAIKKYIRV